jgi:hypothetical protein
VGEDEIPEESEPTLEETRGTAAEEGLITDASFED